MQVLVWTTRISNLLVMLLYTLLSSSSSSPLLLSTSSSSSPLPLKGPFFFGSDRAFKNYFTTSADPENVVIDCTSSTLLDYSAVAALSSVGER